MTQISAGSIKHAGDVISMIIIMTDAVAINASIRLSLVIAISKCSRVYISLLMKVESKVTEVNGHCKVTLVNSHHKFITMRRKGKDFLK
jgi:hypothetical protein